MSLTHLRIYLNDHLAASVGAIELLKRSAGANRETDLGRLLEGLLAEVREDQETLIGVMDRLEIPKSLPKRGGAWLIEKAGRLKLNGSLLGYSPLSRLEELETLCVGVEGKRLMWKTLAAIELPAEATRRLDLAELQRRATRQRDALERARLNAAVEALPVDPGRPGGGGDTRSTSGRRPASGRRSA